jgi:Transposase DDE domain group 1
VRRIRRHWPRTRITIRGDSHGAWLWAGLWPDPRGRREAMDWCEKNRVEYVFGLSKNAILAAQIFTKTDEVCVRRAMRLHRDPGPILVASWRGSKRPGRASTPAMSSPGSRTVPPSGSMTASFPTTRPTDWWPSRTRWTNWKLSVADTGTGKPDLGTEQPKGRSWNEHHQDARPAA